MGTAGTNRAKERVWEKKALGKTAFGRHKALLVFPPECLLYFGLSLSSHCLSPSADPLRLSLGRAHSLLTGLPAVPLPLKPPVWPGATVI